ncbi:MAG: tetratricopeptide repeat protein [Candidatus Obscuribacterales bacterium]|nr:tetratricopeptide repeat protein [Candidatus Obscuribacterales bacterium]
MDLNNEYMGFSMLYYCGTQEGALRERGLPMLFVKQVLLGATSVFFASLLMTQNSALGESTKTGVINDPASSVAVSESSSGGVQTQDDNGTRAVIEQLSKQITLNPEDECTYLFRGNAYLRLNEYQQAIQDYLAVITYSKGDLKLIASAYSNIGDAFTGLNQPEKARANYVKAVNTDPQLVLAYRGLADLYRHEKDYQKAITIYSQAINIDPRSILSYRGRARSYRALGEYQKAIDDYSQIITLEPQPESGLNYSGRAYSYYKLCEYKKAIEDYDQAIRIEPGYIWDYSDRANAHYQLAITSLDTEAAKSEASKAIQDCISVLGMNPENALAAETYTTCGMAYDRLKQYQKALESYELAIKKDSKYSGAYYFRGVTYDHLHQYQKAIDSFNIAVALDPKDPRVYILRGSNYNSLGQPLKAIADFSQAVLVDQAGRWASEAFLSMGDIYNKQGQLQKALEAYSNAIKKEPANRTAYSQRSVIYRELGQHQKGIEDLAKATNKPNAYREVAAVVYYGLAIKAHPKEAWTYAGRSAANRKLGLLQESMEDSSLAIVLNPKFAPAYMERGMTYKKFGNQQKALDDFKKAVSLDPNLAPKIALQDSCFGI